MGKPTSKKQYDKNKLERIYLMNNRQHDLNDLRRAWYKADPIGRKIIENNASKITKESGEIRSMRDALIKEHRQGNRENIKDIHDIVSKKLKYQNG
jgi:hypothetical protein